MNGYSSGDQEGVAQRLSSSILDLLSAIPPSDELPCDSPRSRASQIGKVGARDTALMSGGWSLVPGPWGLLTIAPELVSVCQRQSQMVADIAAVFGKKAQLTREQMLYCLFSHGASQAVAGLVVRHGSRYLVRRSSLRALQQVAKALGFKLSQRVISKGVARWVPVIGAAGVGAASYVNTLHVAETAIELFSSAIELTDAPEDVPLSPFPTNSPVSRLH